MERLLRVPVAGVQATAESLAVSFNGTAYGIEYLDGFSICAQIADTTPADASFAPADVNVATDTITMASHGFVTGTKVRFTTTGTLPAPLATATDYYIIAVTDNTFKVASSAANAVSGTAIDITDAGTGTHTVDTTALAGVLKLQASNNALTGNVGNTAIIDVNDPNAVWVDIASASYSVSGTGNVMFNISDAFYNAFRYVYTATTGQGTMRAYVTAKSY